MTLRLLQARVSEICQARPDLLDREVSLIVHDPSAVAGANPPRSIVGTDLDDFDDEDRFAIITRMEEI